MYVYPLSLDFRSGKGRNVGVKVQFMAGEEKEDVCPHIYGKSCSPSFLREAWCPVLYHNRCVGVCVYTGYVVCPVLYHNRCVGVCVCGWVGGWVCVYTGYVQSSITTGVWG